MSDPAHTRARGPGRRWVRARRGEPAGWLGGSRLGLVVMALVIGGLAGLGAVAFRELVFAVTWLATGHNQFGQQGRIASSHLPWLGLGFFLVIPVLGGLLYGPLVQRFAREARGHGVPEVMLAVAENGGRIRPQVTVVKALASALCIGTGGSVGREGPIVQIGSALASSLGQLVRMSERNLRVIVACGAAGGIAATFNAPITGLFFGFEIVLREFSLDAVLATALSAVGADLISRAFFGSGPFFSAFPHDLLAPPDAAYLLIAVLGLVAGLLGVGFKTVLYDMEDRLDELWRGRPEWARPAVGGIALGALLLVLPQMYGVGYPVMDRVLAGHEALWFIVVLMVGKIFASSLTLSIGGSGGVFAPSLFTGAAGGMAFGVLARHAFGADVGPAAMYAVIAMGGVFAGATQAPLTAIASVLEMTGNFSLTLPVMLVAGIAAAISRRLTYGSIYTTKLLRRGIDIELDAPGRVVVPLPSGDVCTPPAGVTTGGASLPGDDRDAVGVVR
jgi:chloride channel protein, CIC family